MSTAAAAASTTSAGFLPSPSEFVGYVNCTLDFMAETLNQIEYLDMITFLRENIVLVLVVVYILFYIKACLSVTELVAKQGERAHQIFDKFQSVHSGYRPTFWCFNGALNTAASAFVQKRAKVNYERELVRLDDGGTIALDWSRPSPQTNDSSATMPPPANKLVVLVLPGLSGSSKSNYVTHIVDEANKAACVAVVMNYRGIEAELTTPRTYCAANYEDIDFVLRHVHAKFVGHKIFLVGTSLGGIKSGGYLAKHYDDCLVSYAMIVSAPMNTFTSCAELEKTHNLFTFNRYLTSALTKYLSKHKHFFEKDDRFDLDALAKASCIRDFDTLFVAKQFGYESVEAYYRDACLDDKVTDIKVPTLFLNAEDDMFSPKRAFPLEKVKANPNTAMIITKYGGHISFCEGLVPTGCNYTCRILAEYLKHIINEI